MISHGSDAPVAPSVNYEGGAVAEVTIGAVDYRIDVGKQGTAFSISSRATGSWTWSPVGEARWDGSQLRCRVLERALLTELSSALKHALAALE